MPLNLISFIGVPEDKVKLVRKMVGNLPIKVMPMPLRFQDKFFHLDEWRWS